VSDQQDQQASADVPDTTGPPPLQQLREQFPDTLLDMAVSATEMDFTVAPEALDAFVKALRDTLLPPQHLFCDACGVEREETIEAVYRLALTAEPTRIIIRTRTPKSKPVLPTLSHLYKGALWPERELAEMFGVQIVGHPDLRHLLLPEDWQGHPLRKDYVYPLDHPYLAPDPLRDDPIAVLAPSEAGEAGGES
jgi:NADH-quinone oxidoreductase subunit C